MHKSDTDPVPPASERISNKIAELGDWRGDTLARMRALIHEAAPDVVEEWKWMGTPVWSQCGILCTGETYKDKVKLTFAKGAALQDPEHLFNASLDGNVRRAIDITEGTVVDASAFKALIGEAVALNRSAKSTRQPTGLPSMNRWPFDGISLQTQRLTLRPFEERDAPSILALFTDRGFMEYASVPLFQSIEEAHALVARDAAKRAAGERLRLGIERLDDGAVIGYCDLFNIDRDCRKGEIGYGLRTKECGFGFMHEALMAFLDCVLHGLQLNRVMAEIDPANTNSEKTLKRLGFTKEGHFRENCIVNGMVSDSVFYALLKRDWERR